MEIPEEQKAIGKKDKTQPTERSKNPHTLSVPKSQKPKQKMK